CRGRGCSGGSPTTRPARHRRARRRRRASGTWPGRRAPPDEGPAPSGSRRPTRSLGASSSSACRPSRSSRRRRAAARRPSARHRRRTGGGRRRSARRSTLRRGRQRATYVSPFAFRKAFATASGLCLSTSTALFIAIIAASVSFAETALTVLAKDEPAACATDVLTIGATFWNPVKCFGSASTVYFEGLLSGGSVEKTSAARAFFSSSSVYAEIDAAGTNVTLPMSYSFL